MTKEEAIDYLENYRKMYADLAPERFLEALDCILSQPSLPSNLDEAALKELQVYLPQGNGPDGICYFIASQMLAMYKAGAELMAGQSQKIDGDLEKEAEAYWKAQGGGSHAQWDKYKAVVKHFTNWQKEQIAKYNEENNICCMNFDDIEEARLDAYEEGKADMLKEMKRKAQECEIIWSYNETPIPDCTFEQMKSLLQNADTLVGDKVKIIIIKDDERNT